MLTNNTVAGNAELAGMFYIRTY